MNTLNNNMYIQLFLLSLMLSGQRVLGYSTTLPRQHLPMIELVHDETHHIITKTTITQQSMDDRLIEKVSTNKVKYDLGASKNKPLSHLRSPTNQIAFIPSHNTNDNNHDITQYLVDHHVERPMMSRDDWLRYVDQQRLRNNNVQSVPQKSKKVLPSVKLTRFTDDSVMKICTHNNKMDDDNDNYQLNACAQQNIGRNFDINTPWIDIMIHYEQHMQNKKTNLMMNQGQFAPAH